MHLHCKPKVCLLDFANIVQVFLHCAPLCSTCVLIFPSDLRELHSRVVTCVFTHRVGAIAEKHVHRLRLRSCVFQDVLPDGFEDYFRKVVVLCFLEPGS